MGTLPVPAVQLELPPFTTPVAAGAAALAVPALHELVPPLADVPLASCACPTFATASGTVPLIAASRRSLNIGFKRKRNLIVTLPI
jgi:hypothetical protein